MTADCLLYYITDRTAFPGDEPARLRRLLEKIREAACAGVDYVQLREKDLAAREVESLALEAVRVVRDARQLATGNLQPTTALLINSRIDVALAVEADGIHLRAADLSPEEVRKVWKCGSGTPARQTPRNPLIAVSCHSPEEVAQAATQKATFAVFAPVFEKKDGNPAGLDRLHEACLQNIPVLALGGLTLANAHSCIAAGAAGIAGIRLFQENEVAAVVKELRG